MYYQADSQNTSINSNFGSSNSGGNTSDTSFSFLKILYFDVLPYRAIPHSGVCVCVCVNPVLFDQTGSYRPRVEKHNVAAMFLMRPSIVMQGMFLMLLESLAISSNKTLLTFGFISTLQVI